MKLKSIDDKKTETINSPRIGNYLEIQKEKPDIYQNKSKQDFYRKRENFDKEKDNYTKDFIRDREYQFEIEKDKLNGREGLERGATREYSRSRDRLPS